MGYTEGMWTQAIANPDLQIFFGAESFQDSSANAVLTSNGSGDLSLNLASTKAGTFFATLPILARTGVYATTALAQEQFGTAAAQPGPSSVANTSGPLAMPGRPPIAGASMATVAGPVTGPSKKGIQIDSIDVIYKALTVDASTASVGLTQTAFADNVALAVSNIIAKGTNGLVKTARAGVRVINVAVTSPVMLTTGDNEVICEVDLTAGSGGTVQFYGVVVKAHYNFN